MCDVDVPRVVTLIDMDCFFCQVEERLDEKLRGRPVAVVQYNQWKGGGIIAVNYEARAKGVTRHMRGDQAREICPDIELPMVPCNRGKADTSKYREAGKEVANVLQEFTPLLERASVDEAYMDITKVVTGRIDSYRKKSSITNDLLLNTFVLGCDSLDRFISDLYRETDPDNIDFDHERCLQLLVGAIVVGEIRAMVYEKTGFRCSAGIANNKILAKLVCGMNKPNKQTILPLHSISILFESLPVSKIKSLGGKFGVEICKTLNITNMKELLKFTERELQGHFDDKNGSWLYNIARGIDTEPVTPRFCPKSIGCCKKFPGVTAITEAPVLANWLNELALEIEERMASDTIENNRYPTHLVVSFSKELSSGKDVSCSRSHNFKNRSGLEAKMFSNLAYELIKKDSKPFLKPQTNPDSTLLMHPIKFLGLSIGKFEETMTSKSNSISNFFIQNADSNGDITTEQSNDNDDNKNTDGKKNFNMSNSGNTKSSDKSISLTKQESYFANYFKKKETILCQPSSSKISAKENVTDSSDSEDKSVKIKHDDNLNEQCDSNDSIGTIDLEINTSKQLLDPKDEPIVVRPDLGSAFLKTIDDPIISTDSSPVPEVDSKQFVLCDQCNKNILSTEYSTHLDYHFALSIRLSESKLQDNTKQKINVKQRTPTKQKSTKKDTPTDNVNKSIKSFFKSPDVENLVNCDTEACPQCGKSIKLTEFSEHLDYHEAKRLSIELNSNKSLNLDSGQSISGISKRKIVISPKTKGKKAKTDGGEKPINSFFK